MSYTPLFANLQPQIPATGVCSRRQFVGGVMGMAGTLAVAGVALAGVTQAGVAQAAGKTRDMIVPNPASLVPMTSQLSDTKGDTFDLASLAGQPVLINFWATWCAPCVAELPSLARTATALAGDGVTVMLVSIDRGGANKALPFLESLGISGPQLGFDPKASLSREMGVRGLPTTILVDAEQRNSWSFFGPYEWDNPELLQTLRTILADS
jgi:thiol-disulfide isomerase/thioredoxin